MMGVRQYNCKHAGNRTFEKESIPPGLPPIQSNLDFISVDFTYPVLLSFPTILSRTETPRH